MKLAGETRDEIVTLLGAADAKRRELETSAGTLTTDNPKLTAVRELCRDLQAALAVADGWVTKAERAAARWVHQKRREELKALDAAGATQLAAVLKWATRRQRYSEETAGLAGARDLEDPGHPASWLLGHREQIARGQTWWTPRPEPAAPPAPGKTRVTVTQIFFDRTFGRRYPGVEDLDDAVAAEVLEKGWAVPA